MAKDIQTYDVRTNVHVVDVESAIASAKGRLLRISDTSA